MPSPTLRAPGIPVFVTVIALALGLFASSLGISAVIDPRRALGYVPGAETLATLWGGRNLGLGVVLLVAVALRRPAGYAVAFAGQLMRELTDVAVALPSLTGVAFAMVFVAADLVGLAFAWRAVGRELTQPGGPRTATAPR